MESLLQLPQNIWRERIVFFLKDVVELVRLDSAIINRFDRAAFLSNISGCKSFFFDQNQNVSVFWFVLRNIFVDMATLSSNLSQRDESYLGQLLSRAKYVTFEKISLHGNQAMPLRPDWLRSNKLIDLNIVNCDIEDLSALSVCANLRYLDVDGCTRASSESFVIGIQGCAELSNIYIRGCTNLRENAIIALLRACSKLANVIFQGHCDWTKVCADVCHPTAITNISCTDDQSMLPGSTLRTIATLIPQIRSLNLHYPRNSVRDNDVENLFQTCEKLNSIKMFHYTHITNAMFLHITHYLSRLRTLHLEHCWFITDAGIIALAGAAVNLETLRLTGLGDVTDVAIQAVGTHCRGLRCLDVAYCYLLTDSAFATLNVSKLWRLNVSETMVTGTFAAHLFSEASTLNQLFCLDCNNLTADFVHALSASYNKPVALQLSQVNRLTESDWLQLSFKFPNLYTLAISDTVAVNDVVVQSFMANCPKLTNVTINGCSV